MKTLLQAVQEYNLSQGYENDGAEGDYETFVECLSKDIVFEETESEHRWYDVRTIVHKVVIGSEERFFSTFDFHITGDNSACDMDLDMPTLDDVTEVFPHQVMTTIYK